MTVPAAAPTMLEAAAAPLPARWRLDIRWLVHLRLLLGLSLPMLAALGLFGWRAGLAWGLVLLGALMGRAMLWRMKSWVATPGRMSLLAQSAVVALFFPSTLADLELATLNDSARWPTLMAAGMLLSLLSWFLRRIGTARAHALPCTLLLMWLGGTQLIYTDRVLQREDLFAGDILESSLLAERPTATAEPWYDAEPVRGTKVWLVAPAAQRLSDYLSGRAPIDRPAQTISRLVSDDLPPLEDLAIGGHPARTGCASAVAVMIGGLFLVYRGVVSFRIPLLMLAACYVTLMVLPMPTVVGHDEVTRSWLVPFNSRVGWAIGVTLINYILCASPILLTTLIVAVLPGIRPIGLRAGILYAIVFGVLCGACTVLVSFDYGAVLAVVLAQLVVPTLDRRLPSKATI